MIKRGCLLHLLVALFNDREETLLVAITRPSEDDRTSITLSII